MTNKTHLTVGIAATLPILNFCPKYAILGVIAAAIPDMDYLFKIKHRTLTHSLIAWLATTVVVMSCNFYIGAVWGINYLIHLVLDSLSNMGIPFFYPFLKKRYGAKLILTGSTADLFICITAIFFITVLRI